MSAFPDVKSLAESDTDKLMKTWQGLGYYSRARNLQIAARQIMQDFGGIFPSSYTELLKLKAVGEYTPAAVSSICFGEPRAVVDGNVIRVISRLYGITEPVDQSGTRKIINDIAGKIIDRNNPGLHNEALMELGATVCTPGEPACHKCPLNSTCEAFDKGIAKKIPLKSKKSKIRVRYFHYLVIYNKKEVFLQRRNQRDIWNSLYEFPLIEKENDMTREEIIQSTEWKEIFEKCTLQVREYSEIFRHVLTHQIIKARFMSVFTDDPGFNPHGIYIAVPLNRLNEFPVPRLIERYIKNNEVMNRKE